MNTLKIHLPQNERDAVDLNTRMKSSRRGASIGAVSQAPFLFLGVFLKNNLTNNDNGAWVTAQLYSPRRELFIRVFKSDVALLVLRKINFVCVCTERPIQL